MSEKLKAAFLDKEKADLYLFNLDKLKEENAIEETYYSVLKTEYTKLREEAVARIGAIKADIQKLLDVKLKEVAVSKLNHKYLEIRYKVGQIPADVFLKQEQAPKKKIMEMEKTIHELQSMVNATNSAEIGGAPAKAKEGFKFPGFGKKPAAMPQPKSETKAAPVPEEKPEWKAEEQGESKLLAPRPKPIPIPVSSPEPSSPWAPVETAGESVIPLGAPQTDVTLEEEEETAVECLPEQEVMEEEEGEEEEEEQEEEEIETPPEEEAPRRAIPPGLSVTDLDILPDRVRQGNHIGIIASVKNVGQVFLTHVVEIRINGEVVNTAEIELSPGQAQEVTFLVVAGPPGEYTVDIEGREGSYTVVPALH